MVARIRQALQPTRMEISHLPQVSPVKELINACIERCSVVAQLRSNRRTTPLWEREVGVGLHNEAVTSVIKLYSTPCRSTVSKITPSFEFSGTRTAALVRVRKEQTNRIKVRRKSTCTRRRIASFTFVLTVLPHSRSK
ncbi:hypothetical protein PHSY_006186 [Pseudozyma hubeiensis SY62]|uniref:Uncharacterized protein n=1 Tax=Pseudozyma hubeiensis (strain SY62) TaxID=1305764 RepID=R9PBH4_PSEHS|nr:hypothetical protein PHSY_006186 [Pseudozyma hubeiensis SY62]GAC98592.1 hypothetical protein PHSY_006186 [Pseudozyma hubeiensis SY62]